MSHSFKHLPITGITTCRSEKYDKRLANRCLRRVTKQILPDEDTVFPEMRELTDIWCFGKDGKHNWHGSDYEEKSLRK